MRRAFRLRLRIVSGVIIFLALFLVLRLYFVQIVHAQEYSLRAERQYVSSSQELYDRGSILFTRKDGTYLSAATVATGFLVAIDPSHLKDPEAAYAAILEAVPDANRDEFFASAQKKEDPYEVIGHHVDDEVGRALSAKDIPGVIVERERWRTYPAKEKAAQSIGFTGYLDDNTIAGRFGLERYYDDVLHQQGDGAFGNFFAELFANLDSVVSDPKTARQGDVITSIEPIVLEKLDQTLKAINDQYGSEETGGIIMDPATGEIIAMDVYPSFDPNNFQGEDSNHFSNHLVESRYEFGSIFKALTMASGLDAGVITPETVYNDTGCIEVNKKRICNYDLKARGTIPMQEILSQSLNVGASFIATKVGHSGFRTYFTKLGFGTETGIDLPSEIRGDIHNLESPRDVEYDTASFGQGIATTPVETIRGLGALANHGKIVTPHLATGIRLESGVIKKLSWGDAQQVFSATAVDDTTRMLVKVVDDKLGNGTVKIPEMSVAAKTGTAQIAGPDGKYYENLYFHSFFGYFPASDPKYIILLYTKKPQGVQYASETLTHPFIDLTHFLINYYDVPPDRATYTR
ncbi:MAG: cell division protein FtsI (penicillin-binding protein 3) [Parcubacteria bacterium C7867-008]|nr:MAG: cell division protein FtsI (penicillin-binding protein 3) [Parcubacteria bacterium C7867-008]